MIEKDTTNYRFRPDDIIRYDGDHANWKLLQLYEDHILVLDANREEDIGKAFTHLNYTHYNRDHELRRWTLDETSQVKRLLEEYDI
jgi:hypothetical protein